MANILSPSTIKKYATVQNILIVGGALGLIYYFTTGGKVKLLPGSSDIDVDYTVSPMQLTPGQPGSITIKGAFSEPVDNAYYYITDSNLIPVTHGSLGTNVTTFKKNVMLPPLALGKYNVTITDEEIK